MANRRGEVSKLGKQDAEDKNQRQDQHPGKLRERLLLFFIGSAIGDANCFGKVKRLHGD